MAIQVWAVDRPQVSPFLMPDRFAHDVTYFMTPAGGAGGPQLSAGEYWVRLADSRQWLESLVVQVVSPLSSETKAEIELTEEQESWLEWMVAHGIERIRLERV
jgi:hypothetical protein